MSRINNKKVGVIDLFCGIGGLTHGFVKEKFKVLAGIDNDNSCKYAFEANNKAKFISKSVTEINVYVFKLNWTFCNKSLRSI
ncbi:DNA cytosine methyltransferase, partial [Epilithonimonas sp.]|uniref:DNA cytosine methyltransferase n=1 Tax=Epilithonimonas sp. TaxID=2894511 RepID=UPI00289A524F